MGDSEQGDWQNNNKKTRSDMFLLVLNACAEGSANKVSWTSDSGVVLVKKSSADIPQQWKCSGLFSTEWTIEVVVNTVYEVIIGRQSNRL